MSTPRVVVGVDDSPLAWAVTRYAAHHASLHGHTLHIVHAFASDLPMLGFGALSDRSVITAEGKRIVETAAARAHTVDPGLVITTRCHDGFASPALINASGQGTSVVVVGVVGHGIISRMTVGAVAMQVAMYSASPVIVVGDDSTRGAASAAGPVVVGVDGSTHAERALATARDEARVRGVPLHAVRVWEPSSPEDPTLGDDAAWDEFGRAFEAKVVQLVGPTPAQPIEVTTEVARVDPVRTLIDRGEQASLLVVGARGSGGFNGLRLGSTALRLIGHTRCPILISH